MALKKKAPALPARVQRRRRRNECAGENFKNSVEDEPDSSEKRAADEDALTDESHFGLQFFREHAARALGSHTWTPNIVENGFESQSCALPSCDTVLLYGAARGNFKEVAELLGASVKYFTLAAAACPVSRRNEDYRRKKAQH